jgi:hypothetical protein
MTFVGLILALALQDGGPIAILETLEKGARTVKTVEAEFEITRIPGISRLTVALDLPSRRFLITPYRGDEPIDHYLMNGWKYYRWKGGEPSTFSDYRPYLEGEKRGIPDLLSAVGVSAAGEGGASKKEGATWGIALGMILEGKPSKEQKGTFQFYCCPAFSPFRWLGLLRDEKGLEVVREEESFVFKVPARRKTVTVDRETGFLRSIETVDYDGTVRSVVRRSIRLNAPLPPFPAPPKARERPPSREELDELLAARRNVFREMMAALARRWGDVTQAGKSAAVAQACRREFEEMTSLWYEIRLHQASAAWIRRRLDSGTPWKALSEGAATEVDLLLKEADEHRNEDRAYLSEGFREFVRDLEGLFPGDGSGGDPSEYRRTLRSALDFDASFKGALKSFEKQPEAIFKEELGHAGEA